MFVRCCSALLSVPIRVPQSKVARLSRRDCRKKVRRKRIGYVTAKGRHLHPAILSRADSERPSSLPAPCTTCPSICSTRNDFSLKLALMRRYCPSPIVEVISKVRSGDPDPAHISTSFVERQNLTMRMAIRRFTRLTNAFSKKLVNLKMAVALHFAYYNFCRVHSSLRVTPAMEAGITDHVWTISELLA